VELYHIMTLSRFKLMRGSLALSANRFSLLSLINDDRQGDMKKNVEWNNGNLGKPTVHEVVGHRKGILRRFE